jgi:hypothetical protein
VAIEIVEAVRRTMALEVARARVQPLAQVRERARPVALARPLDAQVQRDLDVVEQLGDRWGAALYGGR